MCIGDDRSDEDMFDIVNTLIDQTNLTTNQVSVNSLSDER